jgi:predicted AAA+ superfamily ATPase
MKIILNSLLEINLMLKSFHVSKINPFYSNLTKEIRKMPKIYFTDLGLRNFFAKNYNPIALRKDKGELFENFVFRRFYDNYDEMEIQFWLTQKKHEVDFIINKQKAFEVKFSESQFNKKKYQYFMNKYPDIKLQLIHYNNVNEIKL